jgi:hypothetical protein
MDTTDWDSYGTGKYEKCADCMVHCGYEATAVNDTISHPLKALKVAMFGPNTEGPMAPEIALDKARPAEYVFENLVRQQASEAHRPVADGSKLLGAKHGGAKRSDAA